MQAHTSPARKRFRQLVVSVGLLHVVAIAGYYLLDVATAPDRLQRAYGWTWMGATVAAVVLGLQRVKRARARGVLRPSPASETDADRQ